MALYAEIVEIVAPDKAVAGSRVDIIVKVKNLHVSTITIKVDAGLEEVFIPFPTDQADVAGGQTHSFEGYFTMPSFDDTIYAYSYWYGDDGYFHADDAKTKDIKVTELVPAISEFTIVDYKKV